MKYIKKFNESNNIGYSNIDDIRDTITKDMIKSSFNKNVVNYIENNLSKSVDNLSIKNGIIYFEYEKEGIIDFEYHYTIQELEDEWFIVDVKSYLSGKHKSDWVIGSQHIKCDQLEGLISFLTDRKLIDV